MKNTEHNNSKAKFAARLLAIILSALMVLSMAFYTFYMIFVELTAKDEEEKKDAYAITEVMPTYEM